jgi:dTDP-glucose pyrophosphorylase
MAGLNTRFHDFGFDIPKYLLPWGDKTIITEIISELTKNYKFKQIILLANKRDIYFKETLLKSIKEIGLDETNIYYINDTNGQAHTASIGAGLCEDKTIPFCVHNADTIITNRDFVYIEKLLINNQAFIDVFVANSPNYCYVKFDKDKVLEISEKVQNSPFASSGLYCFQNTERYLNTFFEMSKDNQGKEIYISNLMQKMLNEGDKICSNILDHKSETIVLGSPQEYSLEIVKKSLNIK